MSINLESWFPEVVPAAPLCPDSIITRHLADTCRDFCSRTMLWTEDLTAIDVVEDQPEYQMTHATAEIVGADRVTYDDKIIDAVAEAALDRDSTIDGFAEWRTKTTDTPTRYFVTIDKKVRLVYIPDADLTSGLLVRAILQPLITATSIPDFIWENFKDMVADGAKMRILSMVSMPWTDLALAGAFSQNYELLMVAARQKKFTGFQRVKTRDILRTRYYDF